MPDPVIIVWLMLMGITIMLLTFLLGEVLRQKQPRRNYSVQPKRRHQPRADRFIPPDPLPPMKRPAITTVPNTPTELAKLATKPLARSVTQRKPVTAIPPHPKLIEMLNGDFAAAARLLESTRLQNPGRDFQWVQEKVMWDLERDRT